jgi:hypothetical protein
MKIVMVSGKQGSGKTTLQNRLVGYYEQRGLIAKQLNFADVLYEMHHAVLEVLHRYMPPRDIKKDGPLLQVLGTEWGRNTLGENIWVDLLKQKIQQKDYADLIVIGDCRFPNEFEGIPEALRIRLVCDELTRKKRCSMWRENTNHPSEIGLDGYEFTAKFDMHINTAAHDIHVILPLVLAQLDKNVWKVKRK